MTATETAHVNAPVPMAKLVNQHLDRISRVIDQVARSEDGFKVLGPEMQRVLGDQPRPERANAFIRLAMVNDVLRVVETAILADGKVTRAELERVHTLVRASGALYAKTRKAYKEFGELRDEQTIDFLRKHHSDTTFFGGACKATEWLGVDICRRIAEQIGDPEALEIYERMLLRILEDITAVGGLTDEERETADRVRKLIAERSRTEKPSPPAAVDPRVRAFCSPSAPEVFHATAHANQIWERDPLDVESIHVGARASFGRVLDRLVAERMQPGRGGDRGRILLVLGGSGSGKTHLMRALRTSVHGQRLGYVGYLQMSTQTDDYAHYVLAKLIDSLEHAYDPPELEASSLSCFSSAVVEAALPAPALKGLREEMFSPEELANVVSRLADRMLGDPRFAKIDLDVLRVLLYLHRNDPPIKARALKFLRCEHLNSYDRELLGDIAPREGSEHALRMIEQLGRLAAVVEQRSLVLLVDQLEDIFNLDEVKARVRQAMDVLRHVADHVPSSAVVISCLSDFWTQLRPHITQAVIDRVERDPEPVRLTAHRSLEEIESLVAQRLRFLYDAMGVRHREDEPLFPFLRADLERLTNLRTRDVLDACRDHQLACMAAGRIVPPPALIASGTKGSDPAPVVEMEQRWNDFGARTIDLPSDDEELTRVLAWAMETFVRDLHPGVWIKTNPVDWVLEAEVDERRLIVGLCNRGSQGGALAKQLGVLAKRAAGATAVAARCSEFPSGATTVTAKQIGELIAGGGRRVVVQDGDWRAIFAFRLFRHAHQGEVEFAKWIAGAHPLGEIRALREILAITPSPRIEGAPVIPRAPSAPPAPAPIASAPIASPGLIAGSTRSLRPQAVAIDPATLSMHAAFLGSTGSGKTTLALRIIEQLLLEGTPAVLIDRKGDLAAYASPAFWSSPGRDAESTRLKEKLRDRVEVRLYTPGEAAGRGLSIPVVPRGLASLTAQERTKLARYSSVALGAMMGYGENPSDQARLGILAKAIEILGELGDEDVGLERIVELIDRQDPALVQAIGRLDPKHFSKLIDHLETLRITRGELLLSEHSEILQAGELLAPSTEKTRLSIISTKFLGDNANVEFWVSRLLVETARWASQNPASGLQAVMLFDEADIYLPATRKPATKEPMQDLLRRARSAGVGIFLATQSPGDLDYRCRDNVRTWFVGRVAERTAIEKMKPLLSDCRTNFSGKLAGAGTGEFFVLRGGEVQEIKGERSVMDTRQLSEAEILALARA